MGSSRFQPAPTLPAAIAGAAVGAAMTPSLVLAGAVGVAALCLLQHDAAQPEGVARQVAARCGRLSAVALALVAVDVPLAVALLAAGSALTAWAFTAALMARLATKHAPEPTLVVGESSDVREMVQVLAVDPRFGAHPVATATPDGDLPTALAGGSYADLAALVSAHGVSHVLLASSSAADAAERAWGLGRPPGVRLSVVPPAAEQLTSTPRLVNVRGLPVLSIAPRRPQTGHGWLAKRTLDYVGAVTALVLAAPLLAAACAAIRLEDGGPAFFRQARVGKDGRMFRVWKLRTMVVDAESMLDRYQHVNEASGPYFKLRHDPRVTRVGRWLRRSYIDELPQLINVVRGEMSLVGPRPCLPQEFQADPARFTWRLMMLPGLTGPWQVSGRSWLPYTEGIRHDLQYVEHWSLGFDLRLLARTVPAVLSGDRGRPVVKETPTSRLAASACAVATLDWPASVAPDLSVVVVTHESADDIRDCLLSVLAATTCGSYEVLVVDNASRDGTADIVEREFPHVRLLRKSVRDGFAANCNIGVAASMGRHVLLLNPDTVTSADALWALVTHLDDHPEVGAVGPRLVWPDGRHQPSARRFPTISATLIRRTPIRRLLSGAGPVRRHLLSEIRVDRPSRVDWLLGAALAVRREALVELDGLDDGYRLYCEDIDLCWRLHERGWSVVYLPSVTVVHKLAEATLKRFLTPLTVWHARSMLRFLRQHGLVRPGPPVPVTEPPSVIDLVAGGGPIGVAPLALPGSALADAAAVS
jgi:exopolysaccharide biosynthesis polyprenyl glycosylphosphotransferase